MQKEVYQEIPRRDRYVFRLVQEIERFNNIPNDLSVEIRCSLESWPVVLQTFLEGLRVIGYVIKKEDLEAEFKQILEEWS